MTKYKYINKFKIEKIEQIEKEYNYFYFFRYNDLNYKEKINLIKIKKKLNFNFFFIKQKLIQKKFIYLKGQGSLIIFFSKNIINVNLIISKIPKLEFIYLYNNNKIYSNKKLIFLKNNYNLKYEIKKPILFLYLILKKKIINKANIT